MLTLDQVFEFRGQNVAWGTIGEGDPIILVHGFPWSAQAWRNTAPWIAKQRKVYFFDMVGCGQSAKFDGQDVRESVQSDLLAALIKHWELEWPTVVGHDFGGLASLRCHFVNGIAYGGLVLTNAVAVLPSGSPFYVHVREHEQAFAGLPPYAHEALFEAYTQRAALKPLSAEAKSVYAEPWMGEAGQPAFYRQIAQSDIGSIEEVEKKYRPLDCPVHLVWGEKDTFIPIERGKQLAERLSAESFTPVSGAAHIVQEDAPEAIIAALMSL